MLSQSIKRLLNLKIFLYGFVLLIFLIALIQGFNLYQRVSQNWQEIQFAYNHPTLVQPLREEHASRSAQLEEALKQREPNKQDKLIEQLLKELQSSKP